MGGWAPCPLALGELWTGVSHIRPDRSGAYLIGLDEPDSEPRASERYVLGTPADQEAAPVTNRTEERSDSFTSACGVSLHLCVGALWTVSPDPQARGSPFPHAGRCGDRSGMNERIELRYNVVSKGDLTVIGVSNTEVSRAVGCCLLRLCRGVFSIVLACGRPRHERIRSLITDTEWTEYHRSTTRGQRASDPKYVSHLARLKAIHYPHYRPDDVVVGASAALLHELPMHGLRLEPLTIVHPTSNSTSAAVSRRRRTMSDEDRTVLNSVQVTSAVRTGLDLIEIGGPVAGLAALDSAVRAEVLAKKGNRRLGITDPRRLSALGRAVVEAEFVPAAHRLTRGTKRALTVLGMVSPLSESFAESCCSLNLHRLGLHDFVQQWNVAYEGDFLTRLDFLHRQTQTALAIDGAGKYSDFGREVLRKESYQHNALLSLGFTVVHFSFREVINARAFGLKLFEQAPTLMKFRTEPTRL